MKAKQNMIMAIVMEPGLWNQDLWKGPVGIALGSQLFVDFSDPNIWKCDKEKEFSGKVQDLFEKISIKKERLSNDAIWQSGNEVQFEEKHMKLHMRIESIISGLDADVSASQSEPEPEPSSPYDAATVAGPISSDVSIVSQEKGF